METLGLQRVLETRREGGGSQTSALGAGWLVPGRRPDRPSKGCEIDKEMYRPWTLLTQARDLKISKEWAPPQRF